MIYWKMAKMSFLFEDNDLPMTQLQLRFIWSALSCELRVYSMSWQMKIDYDFLTFWLSRRGIVRPTCQHAWGLQSFWLRLERFCQFDRLCHGQNCPHRLHSHHVHVPFRSGMDEFQACNQDARVQWLCAGKYHSWKSGIETEHHEIRLQNGEHVRCLYFNGNVRSLCYDPVMTRRHDMTICILHILKHILIALQGYWILSFDFVHKRFAINVHRCRQVQYKLSVPSHLWNMHGHSLHLRVDSSISRFADIRRNRCPCMLLDFRSDRAHQEQAESRRRNNLNIVHGLQETGCRFG